MPFAFSAATDKSLIRPQPRLSLVFHLHVVTTPHNLIRRDVSPLRRMEAVGHSSLQHHSSTINTSRHLSQTHSFLSFKL